MSGAARQVVEDGDYREIKHAKEGTILPWNGSRSNEGEDGNNFTLRFIRELSRYRYFPVDTVRFIFRGDTYLHWENLRDFITNLSLTTCYNHAGIINVSSVEGWIYGWGRRKKKRVSMDRANKNDEFEQAESYV